MRLNRPARPIVALLTAIMLLVCQTAFAAQACALPSAGTTSTAVAPCHHDGDGANTDTPTTPFVTGACETGKAIGDAAKVQVYALADLPAVAVTYGHADFGAIAAGTTQLVRAACHSPPLSILHCRLLN